jgi:outer membrane protein TolC
VVLAAAAVLALAAGAAAQGPSATPLTLADAFAQMRERHETLAAADRVVEQREAERRAARSLYFPRAEAQTRLTAIDSPITIDLDPIRQVMLRLHPQVPGAAIPPFTTTVQDSVFYKANVQLTWPFFTGGRVQAANAAAGARVADAREERRQGANALATDVVRRYYALRLALKAQQVRAGVVEGLDRHAYNARRMEEEGIAPRVERLAAEVALAEAQRLHRRAGDDVALARVALGAVLSSDEAHEPVTPLFVLAATEPLPAFVRAMRERQPVLARLEAQADLAAQGTRAERAGRWPDVFAFGLRELYTPDLTLLEPEWAVGIGARWTVFDAGERGGRVAAARAQQARVGALAARARRDLAALVELKFTEMQKARDQFVTLSETLSLAEENLRVRTRAFEEGVSTSLEVVDARLALARVQLERLLAAYEYDVALAELLEASGQSERFEELRTGGVREDVEP